MYNQKQNQRITKCNFCKYFVGNQCSIEVNTGHVSYYYCYDANQEFKMWLDNKNKSIQKKITKR